jgi:uncharacterized protein YgiM (DUF1202 family)
MNITKYTFDTAATIDFGGNTSVLLSDGSAPANVTTGNIIKVTKENTAETWAGTTITTLSEGRFVSSADTVVTLKVYAPYAGKIVKLKVEDSTDSSKSVEVDALTSAANSWETLSFDFSQHVPSTPAFSNDINYDKISVFFDFGNVGKGDIYYFDDMSFTLAPAVTDDSAQMVITLTDTTLEFDAVNTIDFGGNTSALINDGSAPSDGTTGNIVKVTKESSAETWAGTTITTLSDGSFISSEDKVVTLKVYAPAAGKTVRLKVEDSTDPSKSVEVDAVTTVANGWETLSFDFSNQAAGTAAFNDAFQYDKINVFFDFGNVGTGDVYYFDDLSFSKATVPSEQTETTVTLTPTTLAFDTASTIDFGGNTSVLVDDGSAPSDETRGNIVKVTKEASAETWAGTTITTLSEGEFISSGDTVVTLDVYAPEAGKTIRLKLEDSTNGNNFIEVDAVTTVANGWETLSFNFAAQVEAHNYDKASVFFDFGNVGTGDVYYFDDLSFSKATVSQNTGQLLVKNWQKIGTGDSLKAQEFVAVEAQDETATHTLLTNNEGILDVSSLSAADTSYYIHSTTSFDGSQAVSVSDVIYALKGAVGIVDLTEEETFAADIDNSDDITVSDVISILKMAVGIQPVNKLAIVDLSDGSFSDTVNLSNSSSNLDLHAIVMGDVDASWTVDMM